MNKRKIFTLILFVSILFISLSCAYANDSMNYYQITSEHEKDLNNYVYYKTEPPIYKGTDNNSNVNQSNETIFLNQKQIKDIFELKKENNSMYIFNKETNSSTIFYHYIIENNNDLTKVAFKMHQKKFSNSVILIDFKPGIELDIEPEGAILFRPNCNYLIIRGNDAKISVKKKGNIVHNEDRFLYIDSEKTVSIENLKICNFNTAIINHGTLNIKYSTFSENKVIYYIDKDYGGAIRNYGIINCFKTNFTDNYANYGGGIYNEKGSTSSFLYCNFNNSAYGPYGQQQHRIITENNNDIYCCDGANCLVIDEKTNGVVYAINDSADLLKAISTIKKNPYNYDFIKLNFKKNVVFDISLEVQYNFNSLFDLSNINYLIIQGNGATINHKSEKDATQVNTNRNEENHFINVEAGRTCILNNLTITGFNIAIVNYGYLNIMNTTFKNNAIDYICEEDNGGAIKNCGFIDCINCRFELNYAKYGGAIDNYNGLACINYCKFYKNMAYNSGGAIHNWYGILKLSGCEFINNTASNAGGVIYNDYGNIILANNTFSENKCPSEGKDIYNFNGTYTYLTKEKIDVFNDYMNENLRDFLRCVEIVVCVATGVALDALGLKGISMFLISSSLGMFYAGAEAYFEGKIIDHYVSTNNIIFMCIIAGLADGVSNIVGQFIGIYGGKLIGNGGIRLFGEELKYTSITISCLDVAEEIISEVVPRPFADNNEKFEAHTENQIKDFEFKDSNRVSLTQQDIVYVSKNGSDLNNGSYNNPVASLEYALKIISTNGTIVLIGNQTNDDREIVITKNITLKGMNGTVLSGKNTHRILVINKDVNVTLCNLTLKDGYSEENGGAISSYGNLIIQDNVSFIHNTAKSYGGAIYIRAGSLFIRDNGTKLENNSALEGKSIYMDLGSSFRSNDKKLLVNEKDMDIVQCIFPRNLMGF